MNITIAKIEKKLTTNINIYFYHYTQTNVLSGTGIFWDFKHPV